MQYYRELTMIPNSEIPVNVILSKVYQQIHLAFVSSTNDGKVSFGVSFPEYSLKGPGKKIRIFAKDENALKDLDLDKWLKRLQDYVHITHIRPLHQKVKGYSLYHRCHVENTRETKARRYAERHGISYEEAYELFPETHNVYNYPYIRMKSLSSGNPFCLFIKRIDAKEVQEGDFSSYGLSNIATVPEF